MYLPFLAFLSFVWIHISIFLPEGVPLRMLQVGLLVIHSLSFGMSEKVFLPLFLNDIFAEYRILAL